LSGSSGMRHEVGRWVWRVKKRELQTIEIALRVHRTGIYCKGVILLHCWRPSTKHPVTTHCER
jgi:hypothetical protein